MGIYCIYTYGNIILFLYYIWFLILIFHIVYNSVGYLIFLNKIDIDFKKIRIPFIRNNIESFIFLRNYPVDKYNTKKYFLSNLYLSLFVIILSVLMLFI